MLGFAEIRKMIAVFRIFVDHRVFFDEFELVFEGGIVEYSFILVFMGHDHEDAECLRASGEIRNKRILECRVDEADFVDGFRIQIERFRYPRKIFLNCCARENDVAVGD